ncbi:putative dead deah box helicase protein [Eutypa lata UCREL1]|uniref:Putative dead deah box helicase protein n=1 Tax=Eutypa lata (strain UCR-EL1) TaxID=1287681 RepID=M7TSN0_EUTLA|nr:putative dead deah box helicase protein [Eutypa lata UCREL1]
MGTAELMILESITRAGKTVIFTQLIDRVEPSLKKADQTLILAHRRELVEQAARHCSNAYPSKRVEIEMGNMHASGSADITIASVQSITSGDRFSKFDPQQFKLVLVDEAHHIVAPGYLRTLEYFGLEQKRAISPVLVGVSATFSRFDGLRLGTAIDEIVYHKDYIDMIGDKWLSDVIFTTVESTANLSRVKSGANGDFQSGELSRVVNTDRINEITVRSCVDARFVTGDTPKVERSERLDAFKRGEFPVLVNCGVFTEGTDIPNIDCIILARPTRSHMVSSLATGIVTTPTLFGLDPSEIVKDASVDELRSLKNRKEAEQERNEQVLTQVPSPSDGKARGNITFTEYDSVFDLIEDTSGEKHIRSISKNAWVQVAPAKYVLSGPDGTYLRLEVADDAETTDAKFVAWEVRSLPQGVSSKSPYAKPRRLFKATTFTDAVHGADKYASEKYPHRLISRYQTWRRGPPTDGQLKFLNQFREKDDKLQTADITKGKAADMITKLRHGARGHFASINAKRRQKEKQLLANEQRQALKFREKVTVGPLAT